VSPYQKGKTNLDLLEQETVSGSGISWAICKFAPRPRRMIMPAPHHSVFTGRMPFLLPNQQRQRTEYKTNLEFTQKHIQNVKAKEHLTFVHINVHICHT